jgi:hypothetical protein
MAQMFGDVSPQVHKELDIDYSLPIAEKFAYSYYGCCEPLDRKMEVIKAIPNLRKIGVSPWANEERSAEQIGKDYVLSWRPNPSTACSFGVNEEFVRKELRQAMDIFDQNGCVWDVTLKDLETTGGDPNAIVRWTAIIREELEKRYG